MSGMIADVVDFSAGESNCADQRRLASRFANYRGRDSRHGLPLFPGLCCWIVVLVVLVSCGGMAAGMEPLSFPFDGTESGETGLPEPWKLLGHPLADAPDFRVAKDPLLGSVIRLHAEGKEADAVYREANVDLKATPYLQFNWKVVKHPTGTIAKESQNDQAVKVQLDFGPYRFRRRILSYIFDPAAEEGTWHEDSSPLTKNRALVLDSGAEKLDQWIAHSRDVRADFISQYRREPPRVRHISIFCDSNHTDSESLAFCSGLVFSEGLVDTRNESGE